jgi:hypothetical protein
MSQQSFVDSSLRGASLGPASQIALRFVEPEGVNLAWEG